MMCMENLSQCNDSRLQCLLTKQLSKVPPDLLIDEHIKTVCCRLATSVCDILAFNQYLELARLQNNILRIACMPFRSRSGYCLCKQMP